MSDNKFETSKYVIIKEVVPQSFCDVVVNYAKFQALYDFTPETEEMAQVHGTHSRYADFLMESFLLYLQPIIEKEIKKSLFPAYSYYRVYKFGDKLEPHIDRDACEVSATLAFGWPNTNSWPFKLSNDQTYIDGTPECRSPSSEEKTITVNLQPGDMLIYSGPKVKHWRDALQSIAYVQAFFHYVYTDGNHASQKYDKRDAIGVPKVCGGFEYFKYSDWMNALMTYAKHNKILNEYV